MDIVAVEGSSALSEKEGSTLNNSITPNTLSQDQIKALRANREEHRHSQIWTKDPHVSRGGYKKVRGSREDMTRW